MEFYSHVNRVSRIAGKWGDEKKGDSTKTFCLKMSEQYLMLCMLIKIK